MKEENNHHLNFENEQVRTTEEKTNNYSRRLPDYSAGSINEQSNNPISYRENNSTESENESNGQQESKSQQSTRDSILNKETKKVAKKAAKETTKKVAKMAAKSVKKLAAKAVIAGAKMLIAALGAVGLPALLFVIFIIVITLLTMMLSTSALGTGQDLDFLGEDAKELHAYIEKLSSESVDPNKPEQSPFKVPEALLAAVVQLDSVTNEFEEHGKSNSLADYKKILKIFADKLKPKFEYKSYTEVTETKTTSCDENGENCTTSISTTTRKIDLLTHIEAWNGTAELTYEKISGDWSGGNPSTRETYYAPGEYDFVYGFDMLDLILNQQGYKYKDKEIFEMFYEYATGIKMYYTNWLNGEDISFLGDCGSGDSGFQFDANIIPGKGVPPQFMPIYLAASQKYQIPWEYLAAIHRVETTFSTDVSVSSAGAVGHTQFMPCTWVGWGHPSCKGKGAGNIPKSMLLDLGSIKKYGGFGTDANGDGKADPWTLEDAIFSTARYLKAEGFTTSNPQKAIRRYNHSTKYVNDVMNFAAKYRKEAKVTPNTDSKTASDDSGGKGRGIMAKLFSSSTVYADANGLSNGTFPLPKGQYEKYSDSWGNDRTYGGKRSHEGNDIMAKKGVPIYSATDGKISKMGWNQLGGWRIGINSPDGYYLYYAHMHKYAPGIKKGDTVKKGQLIGYVGATGYGPQGTSGKFDPHLHFGIYKNNKAINPYPYLKAWEKGAKVGEEVMSPDSAGGMCMGPDGTGGSGGGPDVYPPGSMTTKHVAAHYLNNYRVSTPFAPGKNLNDGYHSRGHNGIDLTKVGSTDRGDPIYSLTNGKVVEVLPLSSTAGYGVRIKAPDGYLYSYIHMWKKPYVKLGDTVSVGTVLGGIGNSASGSVNGSGGDHLDLKIKNPSGKFVDPVPILKKWAGDWWVKKNLNAYPTKVWKPPTLNAAS